MKYKAMLHLTLSYLPWIMYWSFSAMRLKFGTIVMLLMALTLVIFGNQMKDVSLMDVVAVVYSLFAILITYGCDNDIFIIGDGYIGYGVLFLMSILSRKKRHFIQYYVKKDVSNDGALLRLVKPINHIWSLVFGISALIFLLIDKPLAAVALSNVFVFFGVIFSIQTINKDSGER